MAKSYWNNLDALVVVAIFPFLLEFLNMLIFKKEGEQKQKNFTPKISGAKGIF